MVYREWAPNLRSRAGTMVNEKILKDIVKYARDPGYCSVYGFDQEAAITISNSGTSKGFANFEPISSTLYIDLDNGDKDLPDLEYKLKGFRYKIYSSGGKGNHVVLYHDKISSFDLPYSQSKWVENLEVDHDPTLYHPSHLIALPGRIHPRTRKRKTLIKSVEGENIKLELVKKPEAQFNFNFDTKADLSSILSRLWGFSASEPKEGSRHMVTWGIACDMFKTGLQYTTVEDLLLQIAKGYKNPLSDEEIVQAVQQAYNRISHG